MPDLNWRTWTHTRCLVILTSEPTVRGQKGRNWEWEGWEKTLFPPTEINKDCRMICFGIWRLLVLILQPYSKCLPLATFIVYLWKQLVIIHQLLQRLEGIYVQPWLLLVHWCVCGEIIHVDSSYHIRIPHCIGPTNIDSRVRKADLINIFYLNKGSNDYFYV